jgi:hypothetical protein
MHDDGLTKVGAPKLGVAMDNGIKYHLMKLA